MDISKLVLLALLSITVYGGATEIEFDSSSQKYLGVLSESTDVARQKLRIVAYIPPQDIGFIKKQQNAEIWLENSENKVIKLEGKVISIANYALEPDRPYDFFRYPVVIEADNQLESITTDLQQIKASVKIVEDRNLIELIEDRTQYWFADIDSYPINR